MRNSIIVLALVAACSSSGKGPAEPCEASTECDGELTCLPFTVTNNGVCMEVGDTCSKTCVETTDCADLGTDFQCFATCGSERVCLKTEAQ